MCPGLLEVFAETDHVLMAPSFPGQFAPAFGIECVEGELCGREGLQAGAGADFLQFSHFCSLRGLVLTHKGFGVHENDVGVTEDGEVVVHAGFARCEHTVGLIGPFADAGTVKFVASAVGVVVFRFGEHGVVAQLLTVDHDGVAVDVDLWAVEPCEVAAEVTIFVCLEEVGLADEA